LLRVCRKADFEEAQRELEAHNAKAAEVEAKKAAS